MATKGISERELRATGDPHEISGTAGYRMGRELPTYICHKEVWALKIASIELAPRPTIAELEAILNSVDAGAPILGATITPAEAGYSPFTVSKDYMDRHNPIVGGYYVVYKDGYASFSPAKAFEEGYALRALKVKGDGKG